jgi:uncharacterized protein YlxW (UPF0749 family)
MAAMTRPDSERDDDGRAPESAPRPAGVAASMSLLVDLVTNSLEPEYAAAAARRAESAASAQPAEGRRRPPRRRGTTLVAGAACAGLLLGFGAWHAQAQAPVTTSAHRNLVDEVRTVTSELDALTAQANAVRMDTDRRRAAALSADGAGIQAALSAAEDASASTALTGPGVRITLDDPPGAGAATDPAARVTDRDLQRVVNALWSGGAEAIAIGGVRLTSRSSIRTAGQAVLVDFRPVALPYEVVAIGDGPALQRSFEGDPEAASLRGLVSQYGIRYNIAAVTSVSVPAGAGLDLRVATPVSVPTGTAVPASPGGPTP